MLVASPAYLARRGVPQRPEDLRGHDTITFGGLGDFVAWRFMVGGEEKRVTVASRYTTNSADSAVWYAAEGGGLAMVLAYQAADAIKDNRLQVVLADVRTSGAADPVRLSGLAPALGEGAHLRRSRPCHLPLGVLRAHVAALKSCGTAACASAADMSRRAR